MDMQVDEILEPTEDEKQTQVQINLANVKGEKVREWDEQRGSTHQHSCCYFIYF